MTADTLRNLTIFTFMAVFFWVTWQFAYDYGRESVSGNSNYEFDRVTPAFKRKP